MGVCAWATVEGRVEGLRERKKKREMERALYCRETWIMCWTVDAAVAAAVFQIALNSQRLCRMNE